MFLSFDRVSSWKLSLASKKLPFMMKQYRTSRFSAARISSVPPATSSRPLTGFRRLRPICIPSPNEPQRNSNFKQKFPDGGNLSVTFSLRFTSSLPPSLLSTSRILVARSCMARLWARHIRFFVYQHVAFVFALPIMKVWKVVRNCAAPSTNYFTVTRLFYLFIFFQVLSRRCI